MIDSSTLTFIVILITGFVFLRWFISSEDEEQMNAASSISTQGQNTQQQQQGQQQQNNHRRRAVTTDMIEVVHSIAPHLSVAQIKYDLQRTGSVQDTVDRILSEGTLPFPPGHNTTTSTNSDSQDTRNKQDNIKPENLLQKYGINEDSKVDGDAEPKTLPEKRAAMILKARKRLESQLRNEQDLNGLQKN